MDFPGYNLNDAEECREASALNDRFIHRYMGLLDRFEQLPACDDLIYNQVKDEFPQEYLNSLRSFGTLPPPGDPMLDEQPPQPGDEPPDNNGDDEEQKPPQDDPSIPADIRLMQRLDQGARLVVSSAYQLLMDWCNLSAIVIKPPQRLRGMQLLGYLALFTGNINSSIDQLSCYQLEMAIHLCRRAQVLCDKIVALMDSFSAESDQLKSILDMRAKSVNVLKGTLEEHIKTCRLLQDTGRSF